MSVASEAAVRESKGKLRLGEVLVAGDFITAAELNRALAEQGQTNERIGEILLRLGLISEMELNAVLSYHTAARDDVPNDQQTVARHRLGEVLLKSGKIKKHQLEGALNEQERTNEKLGAVLVRLGLVTEQELEAVLTWQQEHSRNSAKAVRFMLGEVLVAAKVITRPQLQAALEQQQLSKRQIGDILVEAGLAKPNHIVEALRIQGKLIAASLVAVVGAGFLSGCGTGASLTAIGVDSGSNFHGHDVDNVRGALAPYESVLPGGGGSRTTQGGGLTTVHQVGTPQPVDEFADGAHVIRSVPWFHQFASVGNDGSTPDNTCAQAASSMVMHYWQGDAAPSYQQVVDESNRFNLGTTAGTLTSYLQHKGLKVNAYKHGTINFLMSSVDAGHPVICLLQFDGIPHYVVVIGYNDSQNKIIYHDSIDGPNQQRDFQDFKDKWTHVDLANVPFVGGEDYVGLTVDAHS